MDFLWARVCVCVCIVLAFLCQESECVRANSGHALTQALTHRRTIGYAFNNILETSNFPSLFIPSRIISVQRTICLCLCPFVCVFLYFIFGWATNIRLTDCLTDRQTMAHLVLFLELQSIFSSIQKAAILSYRRACVLTHLKNAVHLPYAHRN